MTRGEAEEYEAKQRKFLFHAVAYLIAITIRIEDRLWGKCD